MRVMVFGLFTHIPWTEGADPGRVVGILRAGARFLGYASE